MNDILDTFQGLPPRNLRVRHVIVKIDAEVGGAIAWGRLAADAGRDLHRAHAVDDPVRAAAGVAADADSGAKVQEIQELALNGDRGTAVGGQVGCVHYHNVNFDEWARSEGDG